MIRIKSMCDQFAGDIKDSIGNDFASEIQMSMCDWVGIHGGQDGLFDFIGGRDEIDQDRVVQEISTFRCW